MAPPGCASAPPVICAMRRGDDDALLFSTAERRERPRLERLGARRRQRLARDREVARALRPRMRRDARSVPSGRLRGPCSRTRGAFPAARPPCGARWRRGESDEIGTPSSVTRPPAGCRVPASSRSSVVLPEPLGPISPTNPPRRHIERHAADDQRVAGSRRRDQRPAAMRSPAVARRPSAGKPNASS